MSGTETLTGKKPKPLDKAAVQDMLALTSMQEGILLHELKEPGQSHYKVQFAVWLEGAMDAERFKAAWGQVAASSDMLRTVYRWEGLSQPVQIVLKQHEPEIVMEDLSGKADPEAALGGIRDREHARGFDLTEAPYRILLCRLSERRHAMLICNHHILYDGWSTGLLLARFFAAYGTDGAALQADPSPFKAYVQQLQRQDTAASDAYWEAYLSGLAETTRLPYAAEEAIEGAAGATAVVELNEAEKELLQAAASEQRVTLAALLFAGWGLLLQRYGYTRDAVFGTTVSGRTSDLAGIQSMIGLFINTVPLRVRTSETTTVKELLQQIAAELRTRGPHEHTPLARIQKYGPEPGESLFESIVVVENYPVDPEAMSVPDGTLQVGRYELEETTHYALTLGIVTGERLELTLAGRAGRYDSHSLAALLGHYRQLLLALAEQPETPVAELAMVTPAERERLTGQTDEAADTSGTIDGRFAEQARRTPDAIAVRSPDGELSYADLQHLAERVACELHRGGLAQEEIVGLLLRPSRYVPGAMLGVLGAGGAYLPIHPDEAPERRLHMLEECGITTILVDGAAEAAGLELPPGMTVLGLDQLVEQASHKMSEDDRPEARSGHARESLAYVMYTSGSTGRPKGVMVEHGSVVNVASWFARTYGVGSGSRVLQLTDYTFDPSVEDWFGTLLHGGTVVVAEPGLVLDKPAFRQRLETEQITLLNYVPSILGELLTGDDEPAPASLRTVICGGEPLPPAVKDALLARGCEVYNNYGPTETTVDALSALCDETPVHLGEPIAGMRAYVLGLDGEPVPEGATGELYLAGAGVARGYMGDPQRTAERFVMDPHQPGIRMFRTGDLIRRDRQGRLRYAGRRDEQVKIRGYRVEPGETEAALAADPSVETAAVVAVRQDGRTELHAFVAPGGMAAAPSGETQGDAERQAAMLARLGRVLPAYMLPARIHLLPALPLTRTGKTDRRELQRLGVASLEERRPAAGSVQPRDETERKVWQIWSDVLGRGDFGVTDDFFAIGGDSHRLIRIYSLLGKAFPGRATVQDLFDYRSVALLAGKLTEAERSQEPPADTLREIEF
ncbi:amino acid adenylation domain-containing protein [Paenibacillus sp. 1P07SE]|uniref:amino acid adenylation domain-containing protein n=1 Tax=Paenibacillus sp. 1P07SE TaxID=3132209 RepID=UPI0039A462BB